MSQILSSEKILLALSTGILTLGITTTQSQSTFTLVNDSMQVNHWPGIDGQIGTTDDFVNSDPSTTNASAPNSEGALSYNAFDFGQGTVPDADLFPPGRQAITFLEEGNSVTIDMSVAQSGGGALITGWNVSGSEPFPGHGAYSAQITAVNYGSYDPVSGAFSQNIDFTANLLSGEANSSNFDISGTAFVVPSSEFVSGTGNSYVDTVLIPIAQSANADALLFVMGSGTVPAADNFGFPQMNITATLIGVMMGGGQEILPIPLSISITQNQQVLISWPVTEGMFVLESLNSLGGVANTWTTHPPPYEISSGDFAITLPSTDAVEVFRLVSDL